MKYGKTNINGDAGEYLLAYKFTKMLGWPCRLYGQDLGVDAEIEILDESGISNGDIIKIQIKSVESIKLEKHHYVYVDDRHIEYWKRFCLPVIVCCVDLSTENIYWKQVTATEAYETSGESKKVSFCLEHDKFTSSCKESFGLLVSPEETKNIDKTYRDSQALIETLPRKNSSYQSIAEIERVELICENIDFEISKIDKIINSFPWKISSISLRKLNSMKYTVRETRKDIGMSETDLANGG